MQRILTSVVLTCALVLGACSLGRAEAKAERANTLIVATAYDAKSLDPIGQNDVASANVNLQMYNTLITISTNGDIIPGGGLAESYEVLEGTTYKFKIKKGILFHNGEELKASDVKFSLIRAAKAPVLAHIFGNIDTESFELPDEYTVIFKAKELNTVMLPSLSHAGGGIVNEKAVTAAGKDYGTSVVVGTGPFKFVEWKKSDHVTLERNDSYFGGKAYFKKMEIRVMTEPNSRMLALESGDVDVAYEISANDIAKVEDNKNLNLYRMLDNSTQYLGMNMTKKPLDDVRVRQAISYVVDMPKIVQAVYRGVGRAATGPIGPNIKYSIAKETQPHIINIDKAKELLKEAGYEKGFDVTLSTNEKKERVDMATIIKEQLAAVGINVKIEVLEWSAYIDKLSKGESMLFEIGWTPSVPDPDMGLYAPLSMETRGAGGNFAYYTNEQVDKLLKEGRKMADSPQRKALYENIQRLIVEDCPWVFQYNGEAVIGANKSIENLVVTPFSYHPLYKASRVSDKK